MLQARGKAMSTGGATWTYMNDNDAVFVMAQSVAGAPLGPFENEAQAVEAVRRRTLPTCGPPRIPQQRRIQSSTGRLVQRKIQNSMWNGKSTAYGLQVAA
jgi:hypothetical protein